MRSKLNLRDSYLRSKLISNKTGKVIPIKDFLKMKSIARKLRVSPEQFVEQTSHQLAAELAANKRG